MFRHLIYRPNAIPFEEGRSTVKAQFEPQEGKLVKALGQGYLLRNEGPVENTQSRSILLPRSSAHYSLRN